MSRLWVVRAGRGAFSLDAFLERGVVGMRLSSSLGAEALKDTRKALTARLQSAHPEWSKQRVANQAGQLFRFAHDAKVGDTVLTYDPGQRLYHLGTITGEATYDPAGADRLPYFRTVQWTATVPRDELTVSTRNSLGAIQTIFRLGSDASKEVSDDLIASLDAHEMEHLVAGILRAMGYKTRVSPKGADRGVDVFASPDGLGLQEPRSFVEVKHRKGAIGSQQIRSFLGGRQIGDRCLYVSTGGFTKDARYEADRSSIPLRLLELPDLRELLIDHYDAVDSETRALVPLTRIYWPATTD